MVNNNHVLRRHQPHIMPQCLEFATEMMCPDASLHADQARPYVGKPAFNLASRPLLTQLNGAVFIREHRL
jgi:hypothetical protein